MKNLIFGLFLAFASNSMAFDILDDYSEPETSVALGANYVEKKPWELKYVKITFGVDAGVNIPLLADGKLSFDIEFGFLKKSL